MTKDIHEAMFKLQGVLRGVKKDSKNPHFRNSYASLEQVTDTIRPHMQDLGLYFRQYPGRINDGSIEVSTDIVHAGSGETFTFCMEMPLAKRDPQGAGSAMTYAMRYSLMAALGLPPTDDDAETAIDRNNTRAEAEAPTKSSAALKRDDAWTKAMADLEQDMLDVGSEPSLEALRAAYAVRAQQEGWTQAWKDSLADEFLKRKDQVREANLWAELTAIKSLHGLKTFWEDNSADIKILGPSVLKKFSDEKDKMKLAFEAKNSNLNAG